MAWADQLILESLIPLAFWVLINGVDDLFVDAARWLLWLRERLHPIVPPPPPRVEPRIALLIPCWREADVIEQMLERNVEAIEYRNYDIWLGLYPNDPDSMECVRRCADRYPQIHYVEGPSPGPTTKADCLNHTIEGLLAHEQRTGDHYELFVQHDAEDLIDPQALACVAGWTRRYDMVQIPVFPLATPAWNLTHGVYCDDFADGHQRELPVRWRLGGFVPSAGVGTALRREALDQLRISYGNEVFDSGSLTEDYFLGLRLQRLGFTQAFALGGGPAGPVATRAYFPRTPLAAVKQRTRWTIGNVLQSWERFGWGLRDRRRLRNAYWLWRDRKGLLNHPIALLTNMLFIIGAMSAAESVWSGGVWELGSAIAARPWLADLLLVNGVILVWRQAVRVWWTSRIYGWSFAAAAPLRALWANWINAAAGVRAVTIFLNAKWRHRPLRWSKTQHAYPPVAATDLRVEPGAASSMSWEQARLLDLAPVRIEGHTLVAASRALPSLGAERRAGMVLGRPVRIIQVGAAEFSALRSRFEAAARRTEAAAAQ